jgi:MoxR-like ATPase
LSIHGWDNIEPIIMSAVASNLSVLLIGDIGSNKTEGSATLAKAFLKAPIKFRSYEVPTLNFDDLVGFVNPKHLAKGILEFVPTPLSIWNADAVLFDEINRANPFIQSKLHELIRNRSLMGLPTALKFVFSAVNPPEAYQSGYMDMALASRFVSVQVPNILDMDDTQINSIISGNGHKAKAFNLKRIIRHTTACQFRDKDLITAQQMCRKVAAELSRTEIIFNARQLKMMVKLIKAGIALRSVTQLDMFSDPDANTAYIASVVPEIQGVVRSNVDKGMIIGTIRSIVGGFTLGDPIIVAKDIEELCDVEITDSLAWVTAMKQMADHEDNINALKGALSKIRVLVGKEVLEKELAEKLARHIATHIATKTLIAEDAPFMELENHVNRILETI